MKKRSCHKRGISESTRQSKRAKGRATRLARLSGIRPAELRVLEIHFPEQLKEVLAELLPSKKKRVA